MKNLQILTVAVLSLLMGVACSKMNATLDMPEKMDQTNAKMDATFEQIKKTNNAVHLQALMIALDKIDDVENFDKMFPVPMTVLPFAQTFAEEATAKELVELAYVWIKHISQVAPLEDLDDAGKIKLFKEKRVYLSGLAAISGFIPDKVVEEIVKHDIDGLSRFEKTALQLLALRAWFIRDAMLKESILSETIPNADTLAEAIKYMDKIDYILRLDRVNDVAIRVRAAGVPSDFTEGKPLIDEEMTPEKLKEYAGYWTVIQKKAQDGLAEVKPRSTKGDAAKSQEKFQQEQSAFSAALAKVQQKIDEWAAKLP